MSRSVRPGMTGATFTWTGTPALARRSTVSNRRSGVATPGSMMRATLSSQNGTLIATPAYFVFRHVSQYVDPGAKVLSTMVGTKMGGDALAFKNPDGSIVTVVYNSGAAKTMTVAVGGKKEQFAMPANGWATINLH